MTSGWQSKAIVDVCEIKPSKREAKQKLNDDDTVSFAPMEDLGIDRKFLEPKATRKLGQVAGSYTYFADGDVLLAKITPCFENGKLGIASGLVNGVGFGSSEYIVLRPRSILNSEYLYYFLSQDRFRAEGIKTMSGAVGHKRISKEFVERCQIPLPPLPEQERIVELLDEAFAGLATAIANANQNLRNTRELFVSFLNSIFEQKGEDWRQTRIEDVCLSIVDCPNRTAPKLNSPSPFKMIRTTNVRNGRVNLDNVNYVSEATYQRWTRRQVPQRGDVLLTREAPLGEVGMLRTDDKVFLGQRLVSYRANPAELDNHFLLFALRSLDLQKQIRAFGSGATVQHMRVPDTKALMLSLPPLARQKEIVADLYQLLDASEGLAANYLQKLDQLALLKQSILQRAFSGELISLTSDAISEAAE